MGVSKAGMRNIRMQDMSAIFRVITLSVSAFFQSAGFLYAQGLLGAQTEPLIIDLIDDPQTVSAYCERTSFVKADAVYAAFSPVKNEVFLIGIVRPGNSKDRAFIIGRAKPRNESKSESSGVVVWSSVTCRDDIVGLHRSSEPTDLFNWNGERLYQWSNRFLEGGEPTAKGGDILRILSMVLEGDLSAIDQIPDINPSPYLREEHARKAIALGARKALAIYKNGDPAKAANVLSVAFDYVSHIFWKSPACTSRCQDEYSPVKMNWPSRWVYSFKGFGSDSAFYIGSLNDLGFYFSKSGDDEKAEKVLRAVVAEDSNRIPAYLNLADVLWKLGKKDEAERYYGIYVSRMKNAGRGKQIPAYVSSRLQ